MFKETNSKPKPLSSQPKRSWGDESESQERGGEIDLTKSPIQKSKTTTILNNNKKESNRKEFELTEEDWPASPPTKKQSTSTNSIGSGMINKKNESTSTSNNNLKSMFSNSSTSISRPPHTTSTSTTTKLSASSSSSTNKLMVKSNSFSSGTNTSGLAAIFKPPMKVVEKSNSSSRSNQGSGSSSSTIVKKVTSTSGSTTTTVSTSFKIPTMVPKKRQMPWELSSTNPTGSSSNSGGSAASSSKLKVEGGSGFTSGKNNISNKVKNELLTSNQMGIDVKMKLSIEQQMVLKLVVQDGKNVFFTGSAGTGKSVLLREIIAALKIKHRGADLVAVTASTGMAACNIRGTTIHSFAGIGIGIEDSDSLITKVRKNRQAAGRWSRVKVLVVDEVSMVDGILFDKLSAIAKALKKNNQPFGGIQLVITGDFFQLPPVAKSATVFAFEAKSWSQVIHHTVNLTQVFRQKDTSFIDMLNEMRFGTLSDESIKVFERLKRAPEYDDGIEPTELFPLRDQVEQANTRRLKSLSGELQVYKANDFDKQSYQGKPSAAIQSFMAVERLELKIGAQVMVIKNIDSDLVNGSVGKVIGFGYENDGEGDDEPLIGDEEPDRKKMKLASAIGAGTMELAPRVEFVIHGGAIRRVLMKREDWSVEDASRTITASRNQYPLILAWAMSIHKSQGQTIPRVKVDLSKVFEKGQSYVALSRAVSLDGLQVLGFTKSKVSAHPKVIAWSKNLETLN